MAARVTAIFPARDDAERAADALVDMGADRSHISILSRGEERASDTTPDIAAHEPDHPHSRVMEPARDVGDAGAPLTTTDEPDVAKGAGVGAVLGAIAGVAAGAAMLMVPGFGWVLAAGPLSWAIGGAVGAAVGGAVVGGIYGGLRDLGIPEHHARAYEERIRGGGVLMTALVPNIDEARVRDVLREYNAEDVTFVDDTASLDRNVPAGEGAMATAASAPAYPADTMTAAPSSGGARDTTYATPPTAPGAVIESTTVATYESNIAGGAAKQAEGEWRDRAADRTLNPVDDMAAKGEKAAGMAEEELAEEEETVDQRA